MCKCVNIEMGSYDSQVMLDVPGFMYPIKNCLGEIKYLHELQNLYFAMTGDELKVEL